MLGFSYLLDIGLQHYIFLGLLVFFLTEIFSYKLSSLSSLSRHLCISGVFILNLSFLHYVFSVELLLIQILLSLELLIGLLPSSYKLVEVYFLPKKELSVYFILAILLIMEIAT